MAAAPQHQIGWSAHRQADTLVSDLLLPAETLKIREEARAFAENVLRPAAYILNTTPERRDGFRHDIFKMLNPDDSSIGSIMTAGVSGKPTPPGNPPEIQGGDWAIIGGTGAFLGLSCIYQFVQPAYLLSACTLDLAPRWIFIQMGSA